MNAATLLLVALGGALGSVLRALAGVAVPAGRLHRRFAEGFSFRCDIEPTVLVNWKAGEKRNVKYDSCIRFIDRHKHEILPRVYNFYHRSMYSHVQGSEVIDKKVEKHYAVNSYKYIYAVPFSEFAFVHKMRRIFYGFLFIKFVFLHILFFVKMPFVKGAYRDIKGSGRY